MNISELTNSYLQKYNIDPNLVLKRKLRGLSGITSFTLIYAIISSGSIPKTAQLLGYSENPVKESIRKLLKPLYDNEDYGIGSSHSGWRNTILKDIGFRYCNNCNTVYAYKEFYTNCSKCKYCTISISKQHKQYIIDRTPNWSELDLIDSFYHNCPEGYEVDHIIPLRGKNISGLHVLSNLQYLTKQENRQKSNKLLL